MIKKNHTNLQSNAVSQNVEQTEVNKIPEFVENSFDNYEEILAHITDQGLVSLDISSKEKGMHMNNLQITSLGIRAGLKKRNGDTFHIIVCPDYLSDINELRREIVDMSKSIQQQFSDLNKERVLQ